MAMDNWPLISRTTTADPPSSDAVLLYVRRQPGGNWIAHDAVTTRFGYGRSLREALESYCDDLEALAELDGPLAPPIEAEVDYTRKVIHGDE